MSNVKNFAVATILTPPSGTTGLTMVLNSGQGARMPTTFPYYLSCYPTNAIPTTANTEVVMVTGRSTDTLTIVRGQKTTTALTMAAGWIVDNAIFVEDMYSSSRNAPEVLAGTPNGVLTTFTTSQQYTSIDLYKNGVYMQPAGGDYTLSGTTVTFVTAPATSSKLIAVGIVGSQLMISGSDSLISNEAAIGTPNGATTSFSTQNGYVANSLEVFVNGLFYARGTDYLETSPASGTFSFSDAPQIGDIIRVRYQMAAVVTGNADTTDNFHASATPTANTLLPLDANALIPAAALGAAPTVWTPVFTNLSGGTSSLAGYSVVGNMVYWWFKYVLGSAGMGSNPTFVLPVTAHADYLVDLDHKIGDAQYIKAGTQLYEGKVNANGSQTQARLFLFTVSGSNVIGTSSPTATAPFTWASGDYLMAAGSYRKA